MGQLVELRLRAFKSLRDTSLPIDDLTLLVGRNSSGKSNALDGLWALCRMMDGTDIRDAIEGGVDGPAVRGGIEGCPPAEEDEFTLGCVVESGDDRIEYDVTVTSSPTVQVTSERLSVGPTDPRSRVQKRDLLTTDPPDPHSSDITVRWNNRKQGKNPPLPMRASRLAVTQVATRVPATSEAGRRIHAVAEVLVEALSGVVVLDPVPHAMRSFVPARDRELRRNAENVSATVASLIRQEPSKARLVELMRGLSEATVIDLDVARSELGDVMVTLSERFGEREHTIPARQMSDGTLRFLAVVAAVLEERSESTARTLVIEELENGLHPSQTATVLSILQREARARNVRLVATTHSTAMLDALDGDAHDSVIVCDRSEAGWSRLTPLSQLPGYVDVVTQGGPGEAALRDALHPSTSAARDPVSALDAILRAG